MLPHHAPHTSTLGGTASTLPGSSGAHQPQPLPPAHQPQPLPPASFSMLTEVFADHAFVSDLHLAFMKRDERLVHYRGNKPQQRATGPGKPRASIAKKPQPEVPLHRPAPERQMSGGFPVWFDGCRLSAPAGSVPAAAPAPAAAPMFGAAPPHLPCAPLAPPRLPLAPHDSNASWGGEIELLAKRSRAGVQPSAEQWLWALEAARQRNREAAARAAADFGQLVDQSPRPIAEAA